jgi:hypothetical protein
VTDDVLTFVLIAAFLAVMAAVRFFKTLDAGFARAAKTPLLAGLLAGVLIAFLPLPRFIVEGVLITLAALYVRLTGDESEPSDGMILGSLLGAAAALPMVLIDGDIAIMALAECLLAGAVAGYGITFAALHGQDRTRQLLLDAVTAAAAVGAAWLPRLGRDDRETALIVAGLIPVIGLAVVFKQWPDIRAELRHEASLGFIDDGDVRPTAHPLLRLGRAGWADPRAHRKFVRLANEIALRKRHQRGRPDDTARLYQLEIIKLRMQIQEMSKIDRDTRRAAQRASDTIPAEVSRRE